jgi:hypothetical protein
MRAPKQMNKKEDYATIQDHHPGQWRMLMGS